MSEVAEEATIGGTDGSRFGVLHRNDFFTITPFTGWAFVYAAKTLKEIVLCAVPKLNGRHVLAKYDNGAQGTVGNAARQVAHVRELLHSIVSIESLLSDLTLNTSHKAIQGEWTSKLNSEGNDLLRIMHDYLCREHEWKEQYSEADWLRSLQRDISLLPQLSSFTSSGIDGIKKMSLSHSDVFDEWLEKINNSKTALKTIWEDMILTTGGERNAILDQINHITDELVQDQVSDSMYKVLVLEALKNDQVGKVKEILSNLNVPPLHFVTNTLSQVSDILHIKANPDPKVSLLVDWKMTGGIRPLYGVFKIFLVPQETKSMTLKVYFFVDMWLKEVIAAIKETLVFYSYGDDDWLLFLECQDGTNFNAKFQLFQDLIYDYLEKKIEFHIQFGQEQMKDVKKLSAGYTLDLEVKPAIHFTSLVEECFNDAIEDCMDNCVLSHYFDHCGCIPWTMAYIKPTAKICDEFCQIMDDQTQECIEVCDKRLSHPCNVLLTETNSHRASGNGDFLSHGQLETAYLHIRIPEMYVFAKFIEEYELTSGTFLSNLGGALELWSGVNILGIVHLLVFAFMAMSQTRSDVKASENESQDIDAVEDTINQAIEEVDISHIDQKTRISKVLSWLSSNELYRQTPMSGYAFIVAADTALEKVFWYVVICCLLFLGVYNIDDSFTQYAAKTVHTRLFPCTNLLSLSLPNITMDLHLPLVQLGFFNMSTNYDRSKSYSFGEIFDLWTLDSTTHSDIITSLLNEWPQTLAKSDSVAVTIIDNDVFEMWQESLESGGKELEELELQRADLDDDIQRLVPEIIEAPLQNVADKRLLLKLLTLKSMKNGQLIRSPFVSQPDGATDILEKNGLTAQEPFEDTISSLSNWIHVSLSHPNSSVILTDCSVNVTEHELRLQMQLEIPVHVQELTVEIHSFLYLWLSHVMDWIDSVGDENLDLYVVASMMYLHVQDVLGKYDYSVLYLHTPLGNPYYFFVGSDMQVNMKPRWHMSSKTYECNGMSSGYCTERCLLQSHVDQCGCIPWHMVSLNGIPDQHICAEPCAAVQPDLCSADCNNPCDYQMMDMTAPIEKALDMELQLFKFHLTVPSVMYPRLVQEYAISQSEFLSNLGALLDFWLGVNVLAMMHLLVYIIKQIYGQIHKKHNMNCAQDMDGKIAKLKDIRADIISKINLLREAAATKTNVSTQKNDETFGWLWRHKFYEETNMSGFAFIPVAKNKTEALLWWLLIAMFSIFTIYNISNAFLSYSRKPTQTVVSFGSTAEVKFGNLTLSVPVSIIELSNGSPIYGPYFSTQLEQLSLSAAHYFICNTYQEEGLATYFDLHDMLKSWAVQMNETWSFEKPTNAELVPFQVWMDTFETAALQVLKFFEANSNTILPKQTPIGEHLQETYNLLVNGPIRRMPGAHKRILLLDSFRTGISPKQKLYDILSSVRYLDVDRLEVPKDDEVLLNHMTARELFNAVQQDVSKMVQIVPRPKMSVFFKDWEIIPDSKGSLRTQMLTFEIVVPPEVQELTLEVEYYMSMWH